MTPKYVPPDIHPAQIRKPHLDVGRTLSDHDLWLLDRLLLRTHAHLLGSTGSGETGLAFASLEPTRVTRAE
jgi:hypothetical protein